MRIQHNIMAMNAYRNYTGNVAAMKKNLEKLSSGYKINRAGDDAAGLAISEKMRAQIKGLETAQKNAKDGISLIQTAEGALTEVHDMLNRMVELSTQSANGTYDNTTDRYQLQKEMDQLRTEINRIADSANFNGIKLLDGSLGQGGLTVEGDLGLSETNFTQGITINNGVAGGGTKGVFTLDLTKKFGDGDKLDITFDKNGNTDAAANALGAAANTLTFGADFTGVTTEEQAASIAEALNSDANVTAHFTVEAKGSKVILTNIQEGNEAVNVSNIAAQTDNKTSAIYTTDTKLGAIANAGTAPTFKFENIAKASTGGWDFSKGDTLTFEIKDINNKTWTAKLTIDDDIFGKDHDATVDNIVSALNTGKVATKDKVVYFEDVNGTVLDESKLKFNDMFTVTENGADIILAAKDEGIRFQGGTTAKIKTDNKNVTGGDTGVDSVEVTPRTAGDNELWEIKFDKTNGDTNLSHGDKLTLNGKLADGRTFSIDMVAGVDYTIGSDLKGTMDNLVSVLQNGNGIEVKLKDVDKDGNEIDGGTVKSTDIFGANKELKLTGTTDGLQIDGTIGGKASNGKKMTQLNAFAANDPTSGYVFKAADKGDLGKVLVNGAPKTAATSTVTFGEGLQNGSTLKVGDDTYEVVSDAADAKEGNIAVVVAEADLNDGAKVAKAFADALNAAEAKKVEGQTDKDGAALKPAVTASVAGNEVTLTTRDVGTDIKAPQMSAVGGTKPAVEFTLDPKKLMADSYVKINGNKYQFVDSEDARVAEDVTRVVVANASKASSKELGDALAAAVAGKDADTAVEVNDDGLVTVSDAAQNTDGSWTKPSVGFYNGKGGLTLQIGDTADSWNQLRVKIRDVHCDSLGEIDKEGNLVGTNLSQISISDQESAAAAIDVIKAAINTVSDVRGTLGATQNRLDHTINNLSVMTENIQDAESTIRDTDVAAEMMAYTKNNILIQSAQAMLAQANQVPQGVLQLLQ